MATININLHYEKPSLISSPTSSRSASIAVEEIPDSNLPLGIKRYRYEKLNIFGFSEIVKEGNDVVLVHMLIPGYFSELKGNDLHGLFLVGFRPAQDQAKKIVGIQMDLLSHGGNSCPWLIYMGDFHQNRFTFNNMSFHPFLMIDLTVGYYVCDQNGRFDWDEKNTLEALAIDEPVVYNATLGLYTTRLARLYDPQQNPAYALMRNSEFDKLYDKLKNPKKS